MPPKLTTEEIIARTVAETTKAIASTQTARKPFFNAKSPGMWGAFAALIVYGFTIFGNINGCFQSKYDKDRQITAAATGVERLVIGDSILLAKVMNNTIEIQKIIIGDSVDRFWKSIRRTRDSTVFANRLTRIENKLHIQTD